MRARGALLAASLAVAAQALGCGGPDPVPGCPNDRPQTCPSPAPSFTAEVNSIIQSRCATCHLPGGLGGARVFLQTYDQIFAQRVPVLNQVSACRMPLVGAPPLTTEERQTLMAWLVCGALNN
jgi:uncharacterized membrane protein